jgi:hypothetical protein
MIGEIRYTNDWMKFFYKIFVGSIVSWAVSILVGKYGSYNIYSFMVRTVPFGTPYIQNRYG